MKQLKRPFWRVYWPNINRKPFLYFFFFLTEQFDHVLSQEKVLTCYRHWCMIIRHFHFLLNSKMYFLCTPFFASPFTLFFTFFMPKHTHCLDMRHRRSLGHACKTEGMREGVQLHRTYCLQDVQLDRSSLLNSRLWNAAQTFVRRFNTC